MAQHQERNSTMHPLSPPPHPPDIPPRVPLRDCPNNGSNPSPTLQEEFAIVDQDSERLPQKKKSKRGRRLLKWKKFFCSSEKRSSIDGKWHTALENGGCGNNRPGPPLRSPALPSREPLDAAPPIPPRLPLTDRPYNLNHSILQLLRDNVPWYWGSLRLKDAKRLLEGTAPGTFLVRDSTSDHFVFSMSYQTASQKLFHCHVEYSNCLFRLAGTVPVLSDSLAGLIWSLIEKINKRSDFFSAPCHSRPGVAPSPVTFASYVSRFEVCPSLKYLSRIAVKQNVRTHKELEQLAIPKSLKNYLKECPFYDSELVENILKHRSEVRLKADQNFDNLEERT